MLGQCAELELELELELEPELVEGLVVDVEPLVAAWATTAPPPMSALDRTKASRACRRRCRMFASPPLHC